ncbi:HlyD family secretion protein [Dongshaea marina]|uniref:HlyD family secretion protein n=1 Tax=Dongshaea marina TaxID=2047966 RepID=UPI001901F135|nr:HlyD family secretion protein [Dongshaea marina]
MKLLIRIIILVLILALAGFAYWFLYGRYFQSTDNAYIQTDITNVSSRISAVVVESKIMDNQKVKKGDLLARLDDQEYVISEKQAEATLAQDKADLENSQAAYQMQKSTILEYESDINSAKARYQYAYHQYRRFQTLEKHHYVSKGDMDNAASSFKVAEAECNQAKASLKTQIDKLKVQQSEIQKATAIVKEAQANLEQAKLMLSYTRIVAPIDGVISNRTLQVGMMVQAGQSIASIVSDRTPWISANFKETQKSRMHKGQPVEVSIDAYPGRIFKATVDSLSPATGATFALLPQITQRVTLLKLFSVFL